MEPGSIFPQAIQGSSGQSGYFVFPEAAYFTYLSSVTPLNVSLVCTKTSGKSSAIGWATLMLGQKLTMKALRDSEPLLTSWEMLRAIYDDQYFSMDLEKIWLEENNITASRSKILLLMNSDLDQNCQGNLSYLQMNYHTELCNNKNPWKDKIQMSSRIFSLRCVVLFLLLWL